MLMTIAAIVIIVAATRPDRFRIERSIVIAAPPERVSPLIDDFRRRKAWSPWEGIDSQLVGTKYEQGLASLKALAETP
jgi:hypothetical protein